MACQKEFTRFPLDTEDRDGEMNEAPFFQGEMFHSLDLLHHLDTNLWGCTGFIQGYRVTWLRCSSSHFPSEDRFKLNIRKKFFTVKVVRHCNRLPREVDAPPPKCSKARLDEAWRNLVQCKVSLPMAGRLKLGDAYDPFQPNPFYSSMIYQQSCLTGDVPVDWRSANMMPIYKKGWKKDSGSYRPASLTSVPEKVMEQVLLSDITQHVQDNEGTKSSQHGLVRGRSSSSNPTSFCDKVAGLVDEGEAVYVVCLDFSKAFDTVSHSILLEKLG